MKIKILLAIFFLTGLPLVAFADQPVMNEAPRWAGGWGFQVRHLHRSSDTLLQGDDEVNNPLGLDRRVDTTWLEGVYTFDRSKRITVKITWVDQRRTTNVGGQAVRQHSNGLGDIVSQLEHQKVYDLQVSVGEETLKSIEASTLVTAVVEKIV